MKLGSAITLGLAGLFSVPAAAQAEPSSLTLRLEARVEPFCRIWSDQNNQPLVFDGDNAQLGSVRELCNMPSGYVVRAAFTNLAGGSVLAGTENSDIGADGAAVFSYSEARLQNRHWQLINARRAAADTPVFLRLSISPI